MALTMGTLYFTGLKLRYLKVFKKQDWIASTAVPIFFFQAILKWLQTTMSVFHIEIHTWYVSTKLDGPGRAIQVILTLLFAVEILLHHQVTAHSLHRNVMSDIRLFHNFRFSIIMWLYGIPYFDMQTPISY